MTTASADTDKLPLGAESERLSFQEKAGYACGDMASNLFWMTFIFFQNYFYTDVFGLTAGAAAWMLLAGRWWDALIGPVMGMIADRTNHRWGKYRPYLVWMVIPFGVTGVAAFTTPDWSDSGKLVYGWATYALVGTAYMAINIPYSSLMGVISPNTQERTSVSGFRFVGAYSGGLFVLLATKKLVEIFGGGTSQLQERAGYQRTVMLYAVVAMALFLVTFFTTKERVVPQKAQQSTFKRDLGDILTNGPWLMLALIGIFTLGYVSIRNSSIMYYFKYYVKDSRTFLGLDTATWFMVLGSVVTIVGSAVTGPVAKRVGKKLLYIILMGISAVLTIAFYWADRTQLGYMFTLQILTNFCMGPTAALVFAMFADTADYSEWKQGRRATGLVFSASTFAQTMGWVIGGFVGMKLMDSFGYRPNVEQASSSLTGLQLLMSLVPATGAVASAILMLFYRLDDKTMKKIEADLAERRRTAAAVAV